MLFRSRELERAGSTRSRASARLPSTAAKTRTNPAAEELTHRDPRKVVGLTIKAERLLELRRARLQLMETPPKFPYADPRLIWAELEYAQSQFSRWGWPVVDVTNKSIEEVAAEVLVLTGIDQPAARPAAARGIRPPAWRRTSE